MGAPQGEDTAVTGTGETPDWVADAIFYQIFPDRFARSARVAKPGRLEEWDAPPTRHGFKGGDLLGIVERLDELARLGVNALYLNPIFASAANHRYHTYDYFRVDPLLGGDDALRELLDAAHARGIRVILDGVFNHTGRGFWPFHHILENGEDSPYVDWFHIHSFPVKAYRRRGKPGYECWWNLPALPKLNTSNPQVREHIFRVAEHWIEQGADGWRLDVPGEIDDPEFWRTFRRRVRAVNAEAYLVGEIWDDGREWLAGDRFDGLMNYPLARAALGFFAAKTLAPGARMGTHRVASLTEREFSAELDRLLGLHSPLAIRSQLNLLGSHDTPRFLTSAGGDHSALYLATLLQMTLPGAPCIYYGDEVGMTGGDDPDCRGAFPESASRIHTPTLELFRRAIALRREHAVLRRSGVRLLSVPEDVVGYLRSGEGDDPGESILVLFNARSTDARIALDLEQLPPHARREDLWGTHRADGSEGGELQVEIPARGARVIALLG